MKKILLLTILLKINTCFSQSTGYINLSTTAKPGSFKEIISVAGNNYLTLGNDISVTNNDEIIKWDSNFNVLWSISFAKQQAGNYISITHIAELKDGNYAALGYEVASPSVYFVIKISPAGTILFHKEYTYAIGDLAMYSISAAAGNDNGFVLGGGDCAKQNFLIKCDSSGMVTWAKEYNITTAAGVKTAFSIVTNPTEYIVISHVAGANSKNDITVMNVLANGNLQWIKQLKLDNEKDYPRKLTKLSNGNYAILSDDGTTNSTTAIYFIDATCSSATYRAYSSSTDIYINDIVSDASSNVIAVGAEFISSSNSKHLYLKLDNTGNIVWQKLSTGTSNSTRGAFYGVTPTTNGNFAAISAKTYYQGRAAAIIDGAGAGMCTDQAGTLTASAPTSITIVPKTITPLSFNVIVNNATYTFTPAAITKAVLCGTFPSSVFENKNEKSAYINAYPNPTNNNFTLNYEKDFAKATITIVNTLGQTIESKQFSNSENIQFDVSNYSKGVYYISAIFDDKTVSEKIIVQ